MSASVPASGGKTQSVGLVLSGGGAKGIAHIGLIKALEDNDIPIDYIAGTSMGAIVGGLYAMGYTPEEMLALVESESFSYWSTGQVDPSFVYYFSREEPTPSLFSIPVSTSRRDSVENAENAVPASLISPLPMNFGFFEIFSAYTAQCDSDFNRLYVPFRCVASDVEAGHKVVHSRGDLGNAIRTSMSFPIVFQPIRMNGVLLYDGGIFDNFPVDVMISDFAPDIIIGSDVSTPTVGPQTSLMDQIDNLVMRRQTYDLPPERGIKIKIDLRQFGLLDFPKARQIYRVGYDRALSMMDSICSRVTARIPARTRAVSRGAFKSKTPPLNFSSVSVSGVSPRQDRYLEYIFRPADRDTFGISRVRQSFYRAVSPGRLRDLVPVAVPTDTFGLFRLRVDARPKENLTFGIGGYITSATSSYLFLSARYRTLSFSSVSADINAWIGQSYMAGALNTAVSLPSRIPSSIGLQAVISRRRYFETDRLFFNEGDPAFVVGHDAFARLNYVLAAGARGKITLSAGYGRVADSFYGGDIANASSGRSRSRLLAGQAHLAWQSGTLDNEAYPTRGAYYRATAQAVAGRYHYIPAPLPPQAIPVAQAESWSSPRWLQFESVTRNYFSLHKHFSLGIESDILYSGRPLPTNYYAALVSANAYNPTPASYNAFNSAFRANSFAALALVPIYKYNPNLSARLSLHAFAPMRRVVCNPDLSASHGPWFDTVRFFGELDICYTLPFATLSAYANYASAGPRPWNFGISVGIFLLAPRFLR